MAVLRCKMQVRKVTREINAGGVVASEEVTLGAVNGAAQNAQWSRWTPSAKFTITISNPNAFGAFSNDHEFYIDFVPANAPSQ